MSNLSKTLSNQMEQYPAIKNSLTDFVLDADGKIATALESYSARQLSRWAKPPLSGLNRSELAIDMFLSEGQVGQTTVLQLFIEEQPDLSTEIGHWITQWSRAFQGLFVVQAIPESVEGPATQPYTLTNWLTDKSYSVWCGSSQQPDTISRIQPGEIVLARLLPLAPASSSTTAWTFSGPMTLLGKLGKPKLAVAIGNFKQWFPEQLYGDAPELKAAAWESVQQHYDDFVTFFGSEKITLSGYELSKKLQAYQEQVSEKQLTAAGLDSNQSLQEMAQDAGLSEEEVSDAVASLGDEGKVVKKLLESQRSLKMIMPKVTLPDELRNAKAVTVLVHPKWGQAFFKDYQTLENRLVDAEHPAQAQQPKAASETSHEALDKLVLKYLQDKQATTYVWQQLAQAHSSALEAALRRVLDNPNFIITKELDTLMTQYDKPLTPDLPETASVPIHLHDLFQEALKSVSKGSGAKSRSKKAKNKKKAGFGN
ncbi:MAG: hypothetical protein AAFO06_06640 [Cyanobacteria bacterium J06597_16]